MEATMENTKEYALQITFNDEESFNEFKDVCKAKDLFLDIDDISNDDEGISIVFYGTQNELMQFAEIDHSLHGDGFSFNQNDVIDAMEEIEN
jgi:hypothetical protein